MAKFIFVTGGVVSGLGKGITAASLGRLLKARGFKDKNLGYKIGIQAAPERALNLKDIYVKMQACVL